MDYSALKVLVVLGGLACAIAAVVIKVRDAGKASAMVAIHRRSEHETLSEEHIQDFIDTLGKLVAALPVNSGRSPFLLTACADVHADAGLIAAEKNKTGAPPVDASRAIFAIGNIFPALMGEYGSLSQKEAICNLAAHVPAFFENIREWTGLTPAKGPEYPSVRKARHWKLYRKEYLYAAAAVNVDTAQAEEFLKARFAALPDAVRAGATP